MPRDHEASAREKDLSPPVASTRARGGPAAGRGPSMLGLQRSAGNRAVARMMTTVQRSKSTGAAPVVVQRHDLDDDTKQALEDLTNTVDKITHSLGISGEEKSPSVKESGGYTRKTQTETSLDEKQQRKEAAEQLISQGKGKRLGDFLPTFEKKGPDGTVRKIKRKL